MPHPILPRLSRLLAAAALAVAPLTLRAADSAATPAAPTATNAGPAKPADPKPASPAPAKKDDKPADKKEEPKPPHPKHSQPDWKLEVLLEKPAIHHPSVVCAAPDGRVFVAEDPMDQIGPGNQPIDRILCLHPDGKVTVFAEKLYAVFGMAYYDGKLLVHHSPKFTVFEDDPATGVGKNPRNYYETDNPATWGGGNLNDHIPAEIRLGMDGYFYMSVGDKGVYGLVSNVDKSTAELRGGGVVRFRPDGTDFEVYASGTRNHLDLSINAEDEIFSYDNTDDGLGWWSRFTHLVDGGFYGYPYDFRPHESDADGMARWNQQKEPLAKAKADYDKLVKEAKTDEEKAKIEKPNQLPPPFKPYTLWAMADFSGGSPTGAVGYNEDALPEEYRGNLFHSEWGKNQVERYVVERAGATYKIAHRDEKFLKGGSQPFRPLGICVTADGLGFYVADWNFNGWNSKTDAGRLMKLTYTGPSHAKPKPAWYVPAAMNQKFSATTKELIAALAHPAQSVRMVAGRRIAERGTEAVQPLVDLLKDNAAPKEARWHAIWTLDQIEEGRQGRAAIVDLVNDPAADASVRMQAARQLGTRRAREAVPALVRALADTNAAMRFRAATALGRIGDAAAVPPLLEKLDESDRFARFAVFTALNRIGRADPAAWATLVNAFSSANAAVREGAVFATRETHDATLVSALTNFLATSSNPPAARAAAVEALAPLVKQQPKWNGKWWGTQPAKSLPPARDIEWAATTDAQSALRQALDDADPAVRGAAVVAQRTAPDSAVADRLVKIFKEDGDTTVRKNVLRALAAAKSPAATSLTVEILRNAKAHPDLLPETFALAATLGGDQIRDALTNLFWSDAPADLLVPAAQTLAKTKDAKAVPALAARISSADEKIATAALAAIGDIPGDASFATLAAALHDNRPAVRKAAIKALGDLRNQKAILPLLAIYKQPEVAREAILALASTPSLRALDAYLDGLAHPDGAVRGTVRRAVMQIRREAVPAIEARLDTDPLPTQAIRELQEMLARFVPEAERTTKLWKFDTKSLSPEAFANFAKSHPGDTRRGQKVFADANLGCVKCHKVGNEGADIGPSLTSIGSKYDRNFLVESVLYPSKQILDGYQQTIVRLKDGDVQNGVVKSETATEVILYDAAANKIEIPKEDIKEREHGKLSLMPEGLQAAIKPEDFADLVAYLESLKDKPGEKK